MTEIVRWKADAIPETPAGISRLLRDSAPSLSATALDRALRLPAGSRIRRRMITEALRVGLAAANIGDFESLLPFYDAEVAYDVTGVPLYDLGDVGATHHGHAGIRSIFSEIHEAGAFTHQLEEIADAGGPYFAALTIVRQVGGFSGIELTRPSAHVYDMRGGLIQRQWTIDGWDEGIAKLGELAERE